MEIEPIAKIELLEGADVQFSHLSAIGRKFTVIVDINCPILNQKILIP